MKRHGLVLLLLASLQAAAGPPPVSAFSTLPLINGAEVSPGGRYVAAKMFNQGQYMLVIYDLDDLGKRPTIVSPRDMEVDWVHWKSDERLLASIWFTNRRYGTPVVERRLISLSPDGADITPLLAPKRDEEVVQIGDNVVSFLPDDPRHVLVAFNPDDPKMPRLYKIDIYKDRRETVEGGEAGVRWWTTDQQGRARIGEGIDEKKMVSKLFFRAPEAKKWELFRETPLDSSDVFNPIMFDRDDPDILYVESSHEGQTTGLYKWRMSDRSFTERIFRHPEVDVDGVIRDPKGTEIHGVRYIVDEPHVHWLKPQQQEIVNEVEARIAAEHTAIAGSSWDLRRVLVYAESPDLAGRYYLYESGTKKLQYFGYTYPGLEKQPLAPMRATTFKARDGLEIPAFVTLPPDIPVPAGVVGKPPQPLPAIVFPHGGPGSRDMTSFDPMVQLMASRGFAVLQLNFRGSTGYGSAFRKAGARQWGQAMQDDVTDGTRWLIAEGIADPTRVCIVGWSYGGYAALMGVVKEPTLYRCAASIAGVSDLYALVASERQYMLGRVLTRNIGELGKDRKSLRENSPVNRAAEIRVPVFLAHGTKDRTVPPRQSKVMADALQDARKSYQYLELEDAEHSVLRAAPRDQLFTALEAFLVGNLGPAQP